MNTTAATATATAGSGLPPPLFSIAEVVGHRAYLLRFALRRLGSVALAEDAVHDVFEAVLSGRATFAGRSALRSWLTGVLKHKIVDQLRRNRRDEPLDGHGDGDAVDGREGHAATLASSAPGPHEIAEQRELLQRALDDVAALPPSLREAFRLHVIEERSTASVCATLAITENNLFVRVHRARKQLLS